MVLISCGGVCPVLNCNIEINWLNIWWSVMLKALLENYRGRSIVTFIIKYIISNLKVVINRNVYKLNIISLTNMAIGQQSLWGVKTLSLNMQGLESVIRFLSEIDSSDRD